MTETPVFNLDGPPTRGLTEKQRLVLGRPLNASRIAQRSQGGKRLSYLESWDVRAHLIRVFGYCNFDVEVLETAMLYQRDVEVGKDKTPGWEVAWTARVALVIRDNTGCEMCRFIEAAVGSAVGATGLGDLHDNAVKQAASDGLKRCAINLGSQFGLSLYDDGSTREVVRGTALDPEVPQEKTEDQVAAIQRSLGGEVISTEPT